MGYGMQLDYSEIRVTDRNIGCRKRNQEYGNIGGYGYVPAALAGEVILQEEDIFLTGLVSVKTIHQAC